MAEPAWPPAAASHLLGQRVPRIDGPAKATGTATYSFDVQRPGLLFAKVLRCPHAHARVVSVDVTEARALPGVRAIRVIQGPGSEIQWALDEVAVVAAATQDEADDAARAILVKYEVLPHFVSEEHLAAAPQTSAPQESTTGDPHAALAAAAVRVKGSYGLPSVAHCALEPHGQVSEWTTRDTMTVWASTQGVSALAFQFAEKLGLRGENVHVLAPYVGGGFGAKFSPDRWGIECAELARETQAPVRLFLEREEEIAVAGDRPSCFAEVEIGADATGRITAWSSKSWGSGGLGGSGSPPLPYVLEIPNRRQSHVSVPTNVASSRAWRAPNHPQACLVTLAAIEDLAAALKLDPIELLRRNADLLGPRKDTYLAELEVAERLSDWKARWHQRGAGGSGPLRRGLGVSLHAWGGRGHRSTCDVTVQPDGRVSARLATQDIGTGTRTVVAMVVAETFGLPLAAVHVDIGDSVLPASGGSGGSSTVGGVSASTRRAAETALAGVLEKVAPLLQAEPGDLEAVDGAVRVRGDASRSLPWSRAAAAIGLAPFTGSGTNPGPGDLTGSGVGGVQVAEVEVDIETGVVRVVRMVAVQDCGRIVNLQTAESQVHGGLVMGLSTALYEEKVLDQSTGRLLNADMEWYGLPSLGDVGELIVHFMTGPGYDERGVIGLGEPPVISPAAALSNAVANAIGVRVPRLPLTPDRVLAALAGRA